MEKIRLYLDTNMVHDLFVNQARTLKNSSEFKEPKKFAFMLDHKEKFDFVSSVLTKAEIVRELISAFQLSEDEVEKLWSGFLNLLNCKYIDSFKTDNRLIDVVSKIKMKLRTMMNFQHVFIAMEEGAYFVSGDKDIIEKIRVTKLYDKALTYIELRELAAGLP